jgi:hypothetical protein
MNRYRPPASDGGRAPLDRRYSSRTALSLRAVLITPLGDEHPAVIQNVSTLGFKIPGLTAYSGWVAWSYLGEFGLDVANAIPGPVVEHIINIAVQRGEGGASGFTSFG